MAFLTQHPTKAVISTVLLALTLSLAACGHNRSPNASTPERVTTTTRTEVQPSPQSTATLSPQDSTELGQPQSESTTPTANAAQDEPAANSSTPSAAQPQPELPTRIEPDEQAIRPDRSLPTVGSVSLGNINYQTSEKTADPAIEKAILQAIADGSGDQSLLQSTRYYYDRVDLNGDSKPEALVYLMGSYTCGSGGCTMLVLEPNGQDYQLLSKMTLVNSPILVSEEKTAGWHDLILFIEGGGAEPHYARMQFDGATYPSNPSVAPDVATNATLNGTAIIDGEITPEAGITLQL